MLRTLVDVELGTFFAVVSLVTPASYGFMWVLLH
jgi:hypothetical protein